VRWLWGDGWKDMYHNEKLFINLTETEEKLWIGGEACLWSEQSDDNIIMGRRELILISHTD
jgi:hypothetical protein